MSKVITFSRSFPATHPRAGQPTYFVEKIHQSIYGSEFDFHFSDFISELNPSLEANTIEDFHFHLNGEVHESKGHTIRAGSRFKKGDKFSPRVWSGKPYNSKQIIIAPDQEIIEAYEIRIEGYFIWIDRNRYSIFKRDAPAIYLAKHDGLSIDDFWNWFPAKPGKLFNGQVIVWDPAVKYNVTKN